jgi:hypothetical protein
MSGINSCRDLLVWQKTITILFDLLTRESKMLTVLIESLNKKDN